MFLLIFMIIFTGWRSFDRQPGPPQ